MIILHPNEAKWRRMTKMPYLRTPNQALATPALPAPLPEPAIAAREAVCVSCEAFVGGYKRDQYRCTDKAPACTRLHITACASACPRSLWPAEPVQRP